MAIETITIKDAAGVERQVSADQIAGAFAQVFKIAWGTDGTLTLVDDTNPLPVSDRKGTFGYAAGATATTVDVPAGARLRKISVIPGDTGATITIAGGNTITVPADGEFDEQISGEVATGADVVIGGSVTSYFVSWTT